MSLLQNRGGQTFLLAGQLYKKKNFWLFFFNFKPKSRPYQRVCNRGRKNTLEGRMWPAGCSLAMPAIEGQFLNDLSLGLV